MPAWRTGYDTYTLPETLEDIGETIGGTQQGLTRLGFGSEVLGDSSGVAGCQAARDNGNTFVSISFIFMGNKQFRQAIIVYMHDGDEGRVNTLYAQVNTAIHFPSL